MSITTNKNTTALLERKRFILSCNGTVLDVMRRLLPTVVEDFVEKQLEDDLWRFYCESSKINPEGVFEIMILNRLPNGLVVCEIGDLRQELDKEMSSELLQLFPNIPATEE